MLGPYCGKKVSIWGKTKPLLEMIIRWAEVLLELILGHNILHLFVHPLLYQSLGVVGEPGMQKREMYLIGKKGIDILMQYKWEPH